MQLIIKKHIQKIEQLCDKYNVKTLYLFGSATGKKFNSKSDIDFLVTFGDIPLNEYADYFFDLKFELEDFLNRKIDLITEKSLTNPYLIRSINRNKELLYDRTNKKILV